MNWTSATWLQLLSFPVALTAGQILFKRSAQQVDLSGSWVLALMRLPSMWAALRCMAPPPSCGYESWPQCR
ncbi:MAG TPA: hypothetical protein VGQ27_00165 [Steroidobacteraceae bacterium]|jgi:hypothetical protein|nr:hypothetical protein [Steroidobacteraceae bacterium]